MPFLRLNGWQMKVARGGQWEPVIVGEEGVRTYGGAVADDRRAILDRWSFQAGIVDSRTYRAMVGMLLGRGQNFPFDSDLYSGRGLGPGATVGAIRIGYGSDGIAVVDSANVVESRGGVGSLAVEPGTTNMLPSNERNPETTSGFAAIGGASLSVSSSRFVRGAGSLSVSSTVGHGAETSAPAAAATTSYAGSVYVHTVGAAQQVEVSLITNIGAIAAATVTFTLQANKWNRLTVVGTSQGGTTSIKLRVTKISGAATFQIDCLQVEAQAAATSWADATRGAGNLAYNANVVAQPKEIWRGMTFAGWAKCPTANPSADAILFDCYQGTAQNRLRIMRRSGQNEVRVEIWDAAGVSESLSYTTSPWNGQWHHVAVVVTHALDGLSAEHGYEIYFDGVLRATSSASGFPDLSKAATLHLGHAAGANRWQGLVDEVKLLPYTAHASQLAGMFTLENAGVQLPVNGAMRAEGVFERGAVGNSDFLAFPVYADVQTSPFEGVVLPGGFQANARRINFALKT